MIYLVRSRLVWTWQDGRTHHIDLEIPLFTRKIIYSKVYRASGVRAICK